MTPRAFHLGDILSVTTGYTLSRREPAIASICELLSYLTGRKLEPGLTFTLHRQLRDIRGPCREALLAQHPQLAGVNVVELDSLLNGLSDRQASLLVDGWVEEQAVQFGRMLEVRPMPRHARTPV